MTTPLLSLRGVGKRYRRGGPSSVRELLTTGRVAGRWHQVLSEVDLDVAAGQVVGIVGRNGGGKSTLLRLAAGLTAPTTGQVHRTATVSGLLTLGASAHGELTGRDNAVTSAVLSGLSPRQARARLDDIAEFAGLQDELDRPLRTYSDGMRVRLAFAAAVSTDPELLLVDEVLAVGDMAFQEKCLTRVEALRDGGCGVLVASHVMDHLRRLSSDVVWLRDGTVHRYGTADDVLEAYTRSMDAASGRAVAAADERGFRKGTGDVLVTGLALRNSTGVPVAAVAQGAALQIVLHYRCAAPVEAAHVSVSLRKVGTSTPIVDLTTDASGAGAVPLSPSGEVMLELQRVDLAPGAYWVDCGIHAADWERSYDYRWDWAQVVVDGPTGSGALQPPHRWSLGRVGPSRGDSRTRSGR